MEFFNSTTSPQEARALTVGCLQAIAAGWSLIYMRPAKVADLAGNRTLEPDLEAMVSAAADLAARITQAVEERVTCPVCEAALMIREKTGEIDGFNCSSCGRKF